MKNILLAMLFFALAHATEYEGRVTAKLALNDKGCFILVYEWGYAKGHSHGYSQGYNVGRASP
jgi:hypothetical protein